MGGVGAFDERAFVLGGDPAAIGGSASIWSGFAGAASDTAADLRGLDAEDFTGDEADPYRRRVNADLPPYLDTTSQAWSTVDTALATYSQVLADLQTRMHGLRNIAPAVYYENCKAAEAAGAAALYRGEPGYRARPDGDHDGVACEV